MSTFEKWFLSWVVAMCLFGYVVFAPPVFADLVIDHGVNWFIAIAAMLSPLVAMAGIALIVEVRAK